MPCQTMPTLAAWLPLSGLAGGQQRKPGQVLPVTIHEAGIGGDIRNPTGNRCQRGLKDAGQAQVRYLQIERGQRRASEHEFVHAMA